MKFGKEVLLKDVKDEEWVDSKHLKRDGKLYYMLSAHQIKNEILTKEVLEDEKLQVED